MKGRVGHVHWNVTEEKVERIHLHRQFELLADEGYDGYCSVEVINPPDPLKVLADHAAAWKELTASSSENPSPSNSFESGDVCMAEHLNFGLIGCGEIAVQTSKAILDSPVARVVHCMDMRQDLAAELAGKHVRSARRRSRICWRTKMCRQ